MLDARTLTDPINAALVTALWHSSVPLSAVRYVEHYTKHPGSSKYAEVIAAHLTALEAVGVVKVERFDGGDAFYVLGGENSSDAIRRLGLSRKGR